MVRHFLTLPVQSGFQAKMKCLEQMPNSDMVCCRFLQFPAGVHSCVDSRLILGFQARISSDWDPVQAHVVCCSFLQFPAGVHTLCRFLFGILLRLYLYLALRCTFSWSIENQFLIDNFSCRFCNGARKRWSGHHGILRLNFFFSSLPLKKGAKWSWIWWDTREIQGCYWGQIHTGRARKFECKSFGFACVQCEHSHSHQQVPFACAARARSVWIGLNTKGDTFRLQPAWPHVTQNKRMIVPVWWHHFRLGSHHQRLSTLHCGTQSDKAQVFTTLGLYSTKATQPKTCTCRILAQHHDMCSLSGIKNTGLRQLWGFWPPSHGWRPMTYILD